MTVRYRSATLGEFIEHHSYDVSRGGMFIKTSSPFPSGTLLKFEVRIAEEQRVLQGVGRVVWKREADGATEDEPAGMGIKFIKIDDASRDVIERLVETRGESESAFDRAPASARMFPDGAPAAQPAPEDRTVMKPAKELFADALRMAGEEDGAAAKATGEKNERGSATGFEPARPPSRPFSTPSGEAGTSGARSSQAARESTPGGEAAKRASSAERRSAAQPSTREDEGGVGRTVLLLIIAGIAAAGVFYLTKLGQGTPPEPPPVDRAPQPVPVLPAPVAPEDSVEETTGVEMPPEGDDAGVGPLAPDELDAAEPPLAPSATPKASATPAAEAKPKAAAKPKPVSAPKPVASATPSAPASGAPVVTPAPTVASAPPVPAPVPAPASPSPAASTP